MKKTLLEVNQSQLVHYPLNPRRNNQSAKIVAGSIQEYGYINPIIVVPGQYDKSGLKVSEELFTVIAGNTRFKALKLLGIEIFDVLVVEGLTDEQVHGFVIADNRVGEFSKWNFAGVDRILGNTNLNAKSEFMKSLGLQNVQEAKEELEALIV